MAILNKIEGSIVAHCPGCRGGRSTFEWKAKEKEIGVISKIIKGERKFGASSYSLDYRLFRCAGCGGGAFGIIAYKAYDDYPGSYNDLIVFFPESKQRLSIPKNVPQGISNEFREAEKCFDNNCNRASVGLFRSVLDKTMRANGYKTNQERNLVKQIDAAADDGVITQSRKKRAHEEIRVLGNDVLHDDWCEIKDNDVEAAHHYTQRILEDFYDDRDSVLKLLREANRVPEEDRENSEQDKS